MQNIFVASLILFPTLPSSHSLKDPTMGNINKKISNQDVLLPIDTPFKFPSPLPTWPSGITSCVIFSLSYSMPMLCAAPRLTDAFVHASRL